jgi:hypothetical protein
MAEEKDNCACVRVCAWICEYLWGTYQCIKGMHCLYKVCVTYSTDTSLRCYISTSQTLQEMTEKGVEK